ncbi:uncharacterized protein [Nicotiana sylvestris]|uniref:uncharacterized protein n=1 Tax=Nicotiana sylvestris TaxID=4096 RepID=UPI00388C663B
METDCIWYVRKCYQCQVLANMIKVFPNELNTTSSPWSFVAWGMDVIGPIEPTTSNGHRFILVAIDYFTKWVEVASYKAVTKKVVADFAKDRIVCRFGVTESIVADNAANLNSDLMKAMLHSSGSSSSASGTFITKGFIKGASGQLEEALGQPGDDPESFRYIAKSNQGPGQTNQEDKEDLGLIGVSKAAEE